MLRETKLIIGGSILLVTILGICVAVLVVTVADFNDDKGLPEFETVSTFNGQLRGRLHRTFFDDKPYYAFRGIPYATPPVRELRFKPPQRPEQWNGVRDALEFGSECIQGTNIGSEDCLFVNVYTPSVQPGRLLPVVIAIHGGSFYEGSGNNYSPDFLLNEEDVVLVTLNYRLGPLGFLSLDTSQYAGNMGLKDQLLAIKWTNENIHNFGGNRFQITLHGLSAGSVSAHLHVLSPASKGLFQRAILVSGAANCPWAISHESQVPGLLKIVNPTGQSNITMDQLIAYLQNVDAHSLAAQTNRPLYVPGTERKEFSVFYAPVVENYLSIDAFLEESPMKILESDEFVNDVDVMFSVAFGESYLFIDPEMRDPTLLEPFNETMEIQFPLYEMNNNLNYSSETYKEIALRIRDNYFFVDREIGRNTMRYYAALISDVAFAYGIDRSARRHAAKSSARTYYYRLSVDTAFNILKKMTVANTFDLIGSTHADEHYYTFGAIESLREIYNSVPADSIERRLIKQISSMYTNFIAYGNPTPGNIPVYFEPLRDGENNYLDIGNDYTVTRYYPYGFFWDSLFTEFNMW